MMSLWCHHHCQMTSDILLAKPVGVAFIRLGEVNLGFLCVSPNFITISPLLTNPISCSESESWLLWQGFFLLTSCFLIAFLRFSIFLLNSLTAMEGQDRSLFNKLHWSFITSLISVRCYHLIARKIAELLSLNWGAQLFYAACGFDKGLFCVFWTLALKSNFTMQKLNF